MWTKTAIVHNCCVNSTLLCQYDFTSVYMFVAMRTVYWVRRWRICVNVSWLHNWKPDAVIDSWYVVDVAIIVRWLWYCFGTLGATFYTGRIPPAHHGGFFIDTRFCHNVGDIFMKGALLYRLKYRPPGRIFPGARKLYDTGIRQLRSVKCALLLRLT